MWLPVITKTHIIDFQSIMDASEYPKVGLWQQYLCTKVTFMSRIPFVIALSTVYYKTWGGGLLPKQKDAPPMNIDNAQNFLIK